MTTFDRAAIERIRDDLADLNARCGYASPGLCALAAKQFDACLAEIDRQAATMCAAIDDAPGYPCGCSHELDADGVITTTHTRCEAHRRAEAQVHRLRGLLAEWLEDGGFAGNPRLLLDAAGRKRHDKSRDALAETEGL